MERKMRKSLCLAVAVLLALLFAGNYLALAVYPGSLDRIFTVGGIAPDTSISTQADWIALAQQIEWEGITLLRNEDNTLPLDVSDGLKINLLGHRAYEPVYGGTGSGAGNGAEVITLEKALTDHGFVINPAIKESNIYDLQGDGGQGVWPGSKLELKDVPLKRYKGEASFENMRAYSDMAIVVIGRAGGEDRDLTSFWQTEDRHYLQLSSEEEALIQKATEVFETVIVLYNGANAMEMGFLEEYQVDAALWIGDPGAYGFPAVAKVLKGEVNPSGRLVDTFAYDATSAPSYLNFGGRQFQTDGENTFWFVDYVEGIYVGYRWYETAAAEGFLEYDAVVQYPFGYGLSYTSFRQEIVGGTAHEAVIDPKGEVSLQVRVTNTGAVAGKEVVQVYYTPPYTEYDKTHGIEKAEVNLIAYAKTALLEPGASQTVTLRWNVEDMASYDESYHNGDGTTGCYMLDEGVYTISLRANSHKVIDSVDVQVSRRHFYSGQEKRTTDQQPATNQLQDSRRGIYLSRKDGFANFYEAMASVSDAVCDDLLEQLRQEGVYDATQYDDKICVEDLKYAVAGDLTLADLAGAAYDDPRWEQLIAQMSLEELKILIGKGGWETQLIQSVGKLDTIDIDGPSGLNSLFRTDVKGTQYPVSVVLAATWNVELAQRYGAYIADEAEVLGVDGWYAPAMNIHRSPFSGRNFEYYSEDPLLSGQMGARTTYGARCGSLRTYIKHFVLNDQETHRDERLTTWCSEQAVREIYLRPFELAVKEGQTTTLMTSMNYVGPIWVGNHEGLLTRILRQEWGFVGMTLTDACAGDYMDAPENIRVGLRVGQDMWLDRAGADVPLETAGDIYYAQRAAKNILYAQVSGAPTSVEILPWRVWLVALDVVLIVGIATLLLSRRRGS